MRRNARLDMAGRMLMAGLIGLTASACAAVPLTTAQRSIGLGFRLVVETASAVVAGVVTAPAALLAAEAGTEVGGERAVPGATVVALDREGRPLTHVAPVQTDAHGRFIMRGWRLGEPGFLEVQFADTQGRMRGLKAYVRPETEHACGAISLATTLLAAQVSELGDQVPLFSADKLARAASLTRAQLPALLESAARERLAEDPHAGLDQLLDDLTLAPSTPAQAAQQARATAGVTRVFNQVAVLTQALNEAVETFLDVGFTVQAIAENQAPVVREERIRHLLVGQAELLCRDTTGELAGVTFWLNNERVAEGQYGEGTWIAALDSRRLSDGPYVLSAIGTWRENARPPVISRAFLYVRNTRPAGEFPCEPLEGEVRS